MKILNTMPESEIKSSLSYEEALKLYGEPPKDILEDLADHSEPKEGNDE